MKTLQYPSVAFADYIQGKVFVEFVVDENGNLPADSIRIAKGVHPSLDHEAIRVMTLSPRWIPGKLKADGPNAAMRMIVPITFKLAGPPPGTSKKKRKKNKKNAP